MADTVVCALLSYGAHEVFQQTGPLRAPQNKSRPSRAAGCLRLGWGAFRDEVSDVREGACGRTHTNLRLMN
jgi:hypothetical protein